MKRLAMSALALAFLAGAFAAPAAAQLPGPWGHMYLSHSTTGYVCDGTLTAGVQTHFYLLIAVDTGPGEGIYGWEARVNVPPAVLAISRLLTPPGALEVGPGDDNFIVGTGSVQSASLANPYIAVDYTLIAFAPVSDVRIWMQPANPSTPACEGNPCWLHPSEVVVIPEFADPISGTPGWGRGFIVFNRDVDAGCDKPIQRDVTVPAKSWGHLKARFEG